MVIHRMIRVGGVMLAVLALIGPTEAWAALRAYVDRNPVAVDESFMLTLESDSDLDGRPNLTPLRRDFDIREKGRSSSVSIVNGSVSRKIQWQISLMAKHSGRISIPAIQIGSERSGPLSLTVTAARQTENATDGGDVFMDVTLDPKSVYVQQQAIYTVRLYHAVNLGNGSSLFEPAFPSGDAVVERIGKDKEFETVRNGMRYAVLERRYAIYPQKSGGFDVPALVFDGQIVQGGRSLFAFDPFNSRTRHIRRHSQAQHLDVLPVPAAFHGMQWLPASSLQLEEHWTPNPPHFTVGQAVTRSLSIVAEGLTASQLPALAGSASIDGLKQYPDQPALKDSLGTSGLSGNRTEKVAYIPQQAGRLVLPAIEIPWWNTKTDRQEVAHLPSQTITIEAASGNASAAQSAPRLANSESPPVSPSVSAPLSTSPSATEHLSETPPVRQDTGRWPWVALLLGMGWLLTAVAWWRWSRNGDRKPEPSPERAVPLRDLERSIQASCRINDAAETKAAVLAWARQIWSERPPLSLTAVARNCSDGLAAELIELDRALYACGETAWRGEALWREISASGALERVKHQVGQMGLEPLYPVS